MIYLYDGSLDGYLTCIYRHYYNAPCSRIQAGVVHQTELLETYGFVETDNGLARKVHNAIKEKFTESMYTSMYHAFLSGHPDKDTHLLRYIELGFKIGYKLERLHTHEDVYEVMRMSKRVDFERHRFLGLLRFSDMGGFLYGVCEPENDILPLLGDHFSNRFPLENWVIHDLKRHTACAGSNGEWLMTELGDRLDKNGINEEEASFRYLWEAYFERIGIEERKNPKLQQQFVPLKYRRHIVEFQKNGQKNSTVKNVGAV